MQMKEMAVIDAEVDQELYKQTETVLNSLHISMEDYLRACFKLIVDKKEWVLDKYRSGVAVDDILGVISSMAVLQQNKDGKDCNLDDDPFASLSADEIMEKLAKGREQNQNGEGIPFEKAVEKIGHENHFTD